MTYSPGYRDVEPSRESVEQMPGLVLLEFGASWCGHCLALEPVLQAALAERKDVQHLRIADGRGKPLGRSFQVKLWPTLIFLRDGQVIAELVRPGEAELRQIIAELPSSAS